MKYCNQQQIGYVMLSYPVYSRYCFSQHTITQPHEHTTVKIDLYVFTYVAVVS